VNDRPEQAVDATGPVAPSSPTPHDPAPHDAASDGVPPPGAQAGPRAARWRSALAGDVSLGRQLDAGAVPVDRSAAWLWLLYAGLGFLGGQVLAAVAVAVAAALAGQYHQLVALSKLAEPPTWYVVSTLFGLWGGFFGAAVLASRLRGTKHLGPDLGIRFRWIDLIGIPIGFASQYLVALLYLPVESHIHDFHKQFSAPAQRLTGSAHGVGWFVIAIATVFGAPFFEELFFRGVILRALARMFGRWGGWVGPGLAIVITGCVFAAVHAEALQFAGLAVFGVILGLIAYRTGRIGMNVVAHAAFNLLALTAVIFPAALRLRGLA
jgi:membrane protease YdiL (CAAX protease family)